MVHTPDSPLFPLRAVFTRCKSTSFFALSHRHRSPHSASPRSHLSTLGRRMNAAKSEKSGSAPRPKTRLTVLYNLRRKTQPVASTAPSALTTRDLAATTRPSTPPGPPPNASAVAGAIVAARPDTAACTQAASSSAVAGTQTASSYAAAGIDTASSSAAAGTDTASSAAQVRQIAGSIRARMDDRLVSRDPLLPPHVMWMVNSSLWRVCS